MPVEGPAVRHTAQQTRLVGSHDRWCAKKLAQRGPSSSVSAKKFAQRGPSSHASAKKFPQRAIKRQLWAVIRVLGQLFRARTHTSGRAARKSSRTRRDNMATLKPTTPLHTPNKGPLKPPSPLHPKTAPKTPISHPQRRWRFQSHTGTSEQRRRWFQITGPPGRQGQAAAPAGPEAMSGPAISHLGSLTRTLTR